PRDGYLVGVDRKGTWQCVLNSDEEKYGGTGHYSIASVTAVENPANEKEWSLRLSLPPLGVQVFSKS
ncbi:MAG: 1,4-alpha-glucan branching enzyme, partial [Rhodothermales bacterium]|nr:1,4-alpha-glucan branching enzyme [Rhodothermales bacterium]